MKKFVSLLLICIILLTALVACGGKEEETQLPTGNGGTEDLGTDEFGQEKFQSAVPVDQLDFGGKEVVILCRSGEIATREFYKEETSDDPLDTAINTRNSMIKDQLGLVARLEIQSSLEDWDKTVEAFNNVAIDDVESGLHAYDVYAQHAYAATYTQVRDIKANLADKEMFPWFDFTLPCWNRDMINNTLINGKLYNIAGDMNISLYDNTVLLWLNKTLYDVKKTEDDHQDLQQLAIDGEWYSSDLYDWASFYEKAEDGSGCGSTYGISQLGSTFFDSLKRCYEIDLIVTNNDGRHSFTVKGNTKAQDVLDEIRAVKEREGVAKSCDCGKEKVGHFAEGNYLFLADVLYAGKEANAKIREMDDKYCILPLPKYDENQENYATTAQCGYNLIGILNHSDIDGSAVSAYIQYANELSYTDVRGFYFKRIIEPKFFGGDDTDGTVTKSISLFTIIIESVKFKLDNVYSAMINDIGWFWQDNCNWGTQSVNECFEKNNISGGGVNRTEAMYEQALKDFDNWLFGE